MLRSRGLSRIVIVGGGQVGASLARTLSADHEVVVVDQDPEVGDRVQTLDVEFLLGSGTNEGVLSSAGVAECDFFVAATGLDEVNIVACALANKLARRLWAMEHHGMPFDPRHVSERPHAT